MSGHEPSNFAAKVQRLIYDLTKNYELCDRLCLTQFGVTASQAYSLLAIPANASLSMNDLSETMGLANSTMTRMVDNLVGKGLVHRRHDDEDRRIVLVGLTAKGREVRSDLERAQQEFLEEVLKEIKEDERPGILHSLDKVGKLIQRAVDSACCKD